MDNQDTMDQETLDAPQGEETVEKYGAQVIRRVHADHSILFAEYDEMLNLLEDEDIKKKLEKKLQALEGELTEWEGMFTDKFKDHDYDPLDGAMDSKELEEPAAEAPVEEPAEDIEPPPEEAPAVAATSGEEEVPSPEEVVEGMKTKSLKELRSKWKCATCGSKEMCPACKHQPCTCKTKALAEPLPGDEELQKKPGAATDPIDGPTPGEEEVQPKPGEAADPVPAAAEATPGDEEEQPKPGVPGESYHKSFFEPHEKEKIGAASSFLKQLSAEANYDDDHRMEAHHHWKTLAPIGAALEEALEDANVTIGEKGLDPLQDADQVVDLTEAKGMAHRMHRRAVGEAAGFFKALRREKAFGDEHRAKSLAYHKALDPISKMEDEDAQANVQEPDSSAPPEGEQVVAPGELGEKNLDEAALLAYQQDQERLHKQMVESNRRMARLFALTQ